MNFDEITAVFRMEEGGALTDALYKVSSDDEDDWIIIELSTEKGGDLIFVDALRQKMAWSLMRVGLSGALIQKCLLPQL